MGLTLCVSVALLPPLRHYSNHLVLLNPETYTLGPTSVEGSAKAEKFSPRPLFESTAVMKYVLVSGGVISGIGKGVIASSTGLLLKTIGMKVTSIKCRLRKPQPPRSPCSVKS